MYPTHLTIQIQHSFECVNRAGHKFWDLERCWGELGESVKLRSLQGWRLEVLRKDAIGSLGLKKIQRLNQGCS
jgi:hypothetical protein